MGVFVEKNRKNQGAESLGQGKRTIHEGGSVFPVTIAKAAVEDLNERPNEAAEEEHEEELVRAELFGISRIIKVFLEVLPTLSAGRFFLLFHSSLLLSDCHHYIIMKGIQQIAQI